MLGGLSLLSGAAVFLVWRKRSWHLIDGLVAIDALVLINLAGWLALGAGADQEQLRANLFARAAMVYRETLDLNDSMKALMLVARGGVLQPRDSSAKLIADYAAYMNVVDSLTQLVRIWDRAVLTGALDAGLVSSERIQSHDDLLNAVRSRTLTLHRQLPATRSTNRGSELPLRVVPARWQSDPRGRASDVGNSSLMVSTSNSQTPTPKSRPRP